MNLIIKSFEDNKYLMKLKNKEIILIKNNMKEIGQILEKKNEKIDLLDKKCL